MTACDEADEDRLRDDAARVLDAAADRIERQGLWQSRDDGTHLPGTECVAIALTRAAEAMALSPDAAWQRLRDHVGGAALQWNDDPERTQAEVVAALRAAARGP